MGPTRNTPTSASICQLVINPTFSRKSVETNPGTATSDEVDLPHIVGPLSRGLEPGGGS